MILAVNVANFVTLAVGVIALAAILGSALVWVRVNMAKTTIEIYKGENEALRTRQTSLESEVAACNGKIATLELANRVLADQVTGASAVAKLESTISAHHREVVDLFRHLGAELERRWGDEGQRGAIHGR